MDLDSCIVDNLSWPLLVQSLRQRHDEKLHRISHTDPLWNDNGIRWRIDYILLPRGFLQQTLL